MSRTVQLMVFMFSLVALLAYATIGFQHKDGKEPSSDGVTTGFDNVTNGFEPQGPEAPTQEMTFLGDKKAFDETEEVFKKPEVRDAKGCVIREKVKGGLGPVYNSTSCVSCHQNSGFVVTPVMKTMTGSDAVSGSSSQVSEIRAGHNIVLPGRVVRFKEAPGGSLIQQRAIDPRIQERVPDGENIRTLRMATSVLGDGYVECIDDAAIQAVRDGQPAAIRGTAVCVPVAIAMGDKEKKPVFSTRIGRFGWKCQEASLLNFAAGAYLAEMGITNPLNDSELPSLNRSVAGFDPVKDPEDEGSDEHPFGEDVEAFTRFMRSTHAPPRAPVTGDAERQRVRQGRALFKKIGCEGCHHASFTTVRKGTHINDFVVPAALARKTIFPFSDFLLHDIGTGDGIVQTQHSDLPPAGILVNQLGRATNGSTSRNTHQLFVRYDRLNALLNCQPDPDAHRLLSPGRFRQLMSPMRHALRVNQQPAIQVVPPGAATKAVGGMMPAAGMIFTRFTANKMRTAPLWGLRTRPQLLHDGRALTITDAIREHRKQAKASRMRFDHLSAQQRTNLLAFLNTL